MISVIVPVHNDRRIEACIQSLQRQEYPKGQYEIIVVANNSTDSLKKLIKKHDVRCLFEQKQSSYEARNLGARFAHGEILAFTDSDCIVEENWLNEIEKTFLNKDVDAILGNSEGGDESTVAELVQKAYQISISNIIKDKFLSRVDTRNFSVKKKTFEEIGGFNGNLKSWGDAALGALLHDNNYKIVYNPAMTVKHEDETNLINIIKKARISGLYFFKLGEYHSAEFCEKYFPAVIKFEKMQINIKRVAKMSIEFCLFTTLGVVFYLLKDKRRLLRCYLEIRKISFLSGVIESKRKKWALKPLS